MNKPTDPTTPALSNAETEPRISRLAVRDDGALLVSLEDAEDRDMRGREVIPFLVLNAEESAKARADAEHALAAAAAKTIGHLPKRDPQT